MLVAGMLLFGCPQQGQQAPPQGPTNQNGGNAPGPGVDTPPATGNALDSFLGALGAKSTLQWKVSYDVTSTAPGQGGVPQTSTFQMTQFSAPPTKLRMDSAMGAVESRTYFVDNVYSSCTKSGADWTCYQLQTQPDADSSAKFEDDVKSKPEDYTITADGTMQIAGVTATCYKIYDLQNFETRYCFSAERVPLYVKTAGTANGVSTSTEMKATSYSTSVSDSDFVLPAAATELNLGGGSDYCSYCSMLTGEDKEACLASC